MAHNLFRWLVGRLTSRQSVAPTHSNGAAPYYALTDNNARVELVAHARAAGRENLPEPDASEPNDVEVAVHREHERRHRDLVERTRIELQGLTAELAKREEKLPTPRNLQLEVEEASAAVERDLAADTAIVPLRREQQLSRRNLRAFVREHQLGRDADYPRSRLLHLGVVAVIVVVESVANLSFFSEVSQLGLLGGFLLAVGASLVNVSTGLLAGYFALRWRNSPHARLRRIALVAVAGYVVVTLAFNWGLASWRDSAAISGANPDAHLGGLFRDPLSLSFHSAALFLVGLIASGLALWKGYRLDDPVPHYGDRHRRFTAADQGLEQASERLRRTVLAHAESVPDRCRRLVREAGQHLEELGRTVTRAEKAVEAYEAERERIERWCCQWLRRYRSENSSIRTSPAPAYFSIYPSFPSQVDAGPVESLKRRLRHAARAVEAVKAEANRICSAQSARVAEARRRFEAALGHLLHEADHGRGDGSTRGEGSPSPGERP